MIIIQDWFLEHSSVRFSPVYQIQKHCSSQILLLKMARVVFLLLTLALLHLLHLAQATTCQGDNCPTGDEEKTIAFNTVLISLMQLSLLIVFHATFLLQES